MRYPGSKKQQSKKIVDLIYQDIKKGGDVIWCEPFLGGNNLLIEANKKMKIDGVWFNDNNEDLIDLHTNLIKYNNLSDFLVNNDFPKHIISFIEMIKKGEDCTNSEIFNKQKFNEYVNDDSIPKWKRLFIVNIFGFNGLNFFKDYKNRQQFTLDYNGGSKKMISAIKTTEEWMNDIYNIKKRLTFENKHYLIYSDDYKNYFNGIKKWIEINNDKTIIIYLDPPYLQKFKIHTYKDINYDEFLLNVKDLNKYKNVFIYLSEGELLKNDSLIVLNEFKTKSIFLAKDNYKIRKEFLYKFKKDF